MEIFVVLGILVVISALSPIFGTDSRRSELLRNR